MFGSLLTRLANSKFLKTFIGDTGGYIKVICVHKVNVNSKNDTHENTKNIPYY